MNVEYTVCVQHFRENRLKHKYYILYKKRSILKTDPFKKK